jgi:ferredoxin
MLDFTAELAATSRLGCQIRMAPALDGLTVRVPRSTLLG